MSDNTIQFEGVKMGLKQSKEGFVLTLAVHPDELPDAMMRDFVGSRYVVVMVRLGDDEQPMNREGEFPGDHAVKMAGILCRDKEFWEWLHSKEWLLEKNEKACSEWICSYLDIESRKELKTNADARDLFNRLKASFNAWHNQ
jgi:hypothetical protein